MLVVRLPQTAPAGVACHLRQLYYWDLGHFYIVLLTVFGLGLLNCLELKRWVNLGLLIVALVGNNVVLEVSVEVVVPFDAGEHHECLRLFLNPAIDACVFLLRVADCGWLVESHPCPLLFLQLHVDAEHLQLFDELGAVLPQ